MGYAAVASIQRDNDIRLRISACAALLDIGDFNPWGWVDMRMWKFAAQPTWGDAYEYAQNTHLQDSNYRPGWDAGVITDGMILAAVELLRQEELNQNPQPFME